MTELLTPEQTAELLHMSPNTLSSWRWKGRGPEFIKVGRNVRYDRADVDAWLRDNKTSFSQRVVQ